MLKIHSTYSVKLNNGVNGRAFQQTVRLYRKAVDFYIAVMLQEQKEFFRLSNQNAAVRLAEQLSVATKKRPSVRYDFSNEFYKFPCYLRRAAIAEAYGKYLSYTSLVKNWENSDKRTRGAKPSLPKAGMYRDNCYVRTDTYTAIIKVFVRNTWDWETVTLRKSDIDYITRHCAGKKECVPTLQCRGKCWYLNFCFEEETELHNTWIFEQTIVAVDLGLNSACTCSVMRSDGTVIGRRFLKLPREYDSLNRKVSRIKYAQRHGARQTRGLWRLADGVNDDIAVKMAQFIIDTAVMYDADTIVFEALDLSGKKRGSKKQKLHLWKARRVQSITTDKAHRLSMRISRVNAWNTSRLAFDGSGRVLRGKESEKTHGSYSVCEFQSGKIYNCDLNASYNIGARYFVREITKSLPVTQGQRIAAKVPGCAKRSTCTLSTLISLQAELYAAA